MTSHLNTCTSSFSALDRFIANEQYSEAVMLGLQMLHEGADHELVEDELCFSLAAFVTQLVVMNRIDNAKWLWRKALDSCEWKSTVLLHGYAKFKCSIDEVVDGIDAIQSKLTSPTSLMTVGMALTESVENMKALVVDQWHYRMLNDKERNVAYDHAIRRALMLRPGAVVLDIGGGTGLLSMFAARAGARHVYCCEMSKPLALIASRCLRLNGFSDRVTVLQKHSRDLVLGVDIPERVDVIVTELVDSGLLGEHIMATLQHARTHFLAQADASQGVSEGIVIPHAATIQAMALSSRALASRRSLLPPPPPLHESHCLYSSTSAEKSNSWSRLQYDILSQQSAVPKVDEAYTCEPLDSGLEYVPLTDTFSVGTVVFDHRVPHDYRSLLRVPAVASGSVDAIAYWFEMQLLDPVHRGAISDDAPLVVSTAPGRVGNSWDQAMVFSAQTVQAKMGQALTIYCNVTQDLVQIQATLPLDVCGHDSLGDAHDHDEQQERVNVSHTAVGEMDMAALNDFQVTEAVMSVLHHRVVGIRNFYNWSDLSILELCNTWRSFALNYQLFLTTERGKNCVRPLRLQSMVTCSSNQQMEFLSKIVQSSGVECSLSTGPLVEAFAGNGSASTPDASSEKSCASNTREQCDLLVCDLIEGSGMMRQGVLADISFALKIMMTQRPQWAPCNDKWSLQERVIPYSLGIVLSLVESYTLFSQFRIDPSCSAQIDVGSELDKYKVVVLRELNLSPLLPFPVSASLGNTRDGHVQENIRGGSPHRDRFLCGAVQVLELPLVQVLSPARSKNTQAVEDDMEGEGDIDDDSVEDDDVISEDVYSLTAVTPGTVHCIALWYRIYLSADVSRREGRGHDDDLIDTGPTERLCTMEEGNKEAVAHWRQVGFLLETPREVRVGEIVSVRVVVGRTVGVWCEVLP